LRYSDSEISKIMFHYVYVLESEQNGELYIGRTTDIKKRFKEHNQGLSTYTKRYLPWKLVYYEACISEMDAKRRESYLKTSQGSRLLKRRLKEYLFSTRS
jgi:putative endonuclease